MRKIEPEKAEDICNFLNKANIDIDLMPDIDWPDDVFDNAIALYMDYVDAYGGCPDIAANAYNDAQKAAITKSQAAFAECFFETECKESALDAAFKSYCDVMKDEFYYKLIQYRWQRVQQYRKKTSVISQVRYRDYLDALDVASYVEYSPPVAA